MQRIFSGRYRNILLADTVPVLHKGTRAAGRTIHQAFDPDLNYRNTREILILAAHFTAIDL